MKEKNYDKFLEKLCTRVWAPKGLRILTDVAALDMLRTSKQILYKK